MVSKKRRDYGKVILLSIFLLLCILVSASVGSASLTIWESLRVLVAKIPMVKRLVASDSMGAMYEVIIWKVRMPRILQAALVGGSLAVVGCTFQAIFRNALADPHILGISSGASLGATIGMMSGVTVHFLGLGVTSIFAFIGAILTVGIVYQLGTLGRRMVVTHVLLVGTAMSTFLSAMISLLMIFHREQIEKVYLWTLGSFNAANWYKVSYMAVVGTVGIGVIWIFARDLNVLITGDEVAASLGIEILKVKKLLIMIASLLVAASVSISGAIGFVGLIIPHCMRLLLGADHRRLIPVCALGGASFMVLCDTLARTIAAPIEIPVGVITAIFGAPYFIFLLYRDTKRGSYRKEMG